MTDPDLFLHSVPNLALQLPTVSRPNDADSILRRAEDHFARGRRAYSEERHEEARREFNLAVDTLLAAPENLPGRTRIERRLEEMSQSIYQYDISGLGAGQPDDKVTLEQSPRDAILELTFPIDPRMKSKVLEEIKATASELPLEINDAVLSYVSFFSTNRGRKILISGLRRSGRYRDMILKALAEQGLPKELLYLAQIESAFMPRAVSRAKCVGMWQFAKFRGIEYGLQVTPHLDARMDPEAATRAAARHLRDLYNHFGDWYLAMSAYNCGPGCVDRAVMRTGYADFWRLSSMNVLPKETRNYVPVILAITIMAKNPKDYGLEDIQYDAPIEYDTIQLDAPTNVALIADATDRPASEIRELNPALLKTLAPAGYAMRVPKGMVNQVRAAFELVPAAKRAAWRLHRVERGDTLAAIARRYGTSASLINSANDGDDLEAGSLLVIPSAFQAEKPAVKAKSKPRRKASAARRG